MDVVFNHELLIEQRKKWTMLQMQSFTKCKEVKKLHGNIIKNTAKNIKQKKFKIRFEMILVVIIDYYSLFYVQFVSCLFLVLAIYRIPSFQINNALFQNGFIYIRELRITNFLLLCSKFSSYVINRKIYLYFISFLIGGW